MSWLLYLAGLIVFSVYFVGFQKAVGGLDADQQRRLLSEGRPPWFYYAALLALIVAILVAANLVVVVGAAIALLGLALWGQTNHQRRLEELGFTADYRGRLTRIFPLSLLGVALLMAATILFAAGRR